MQMTLITHHQATAVVHPGEAAFDFPALAVALSGSDRATPLGMLSLPSFKGGDGRLNAARPQLASQLRTIKTFVRHQLLRSGFRTPALLRHTTGVEGRFGQRHFMRLSAVHMQAQWQTIAIYHRHDFAALADFGFAYSIAPFLAGTKLPSKKACAQTNFSSASSWLKSARQIRSQVPFSDHSFKRRQQVVSEPYSRGRSSQAQPVFSTYRMPFSVFRSSARLRPAPGFCFGMNGSMTAHCSSFRSCLLMPPF